MLKTFSLFSLFAISFFSCKQNKGSSKYYDIILRNDIEIKDPYANGMFYQGLKFEEQKDWQKAKDCFFEADKSYPNSPVILNALGSMVSRTEGAPESFQYFQKALNIDSDFIKTYVNYGACLNGALHFEEAKAILRAGLNKNPKYEIDKRSLYANLAVTYFALNKKDTAYSFIDSAKAGLKEGDFYNKILAVENQLRSQ